MTAKKPVLNDREEAVRGRIIEIAGALEHEFGLDGWYQISHRFESGLHGDDALDSSGDLTCYTTTALTVVSWEYRQARITWFLPTASLQTDQALTETAIHEYMHILLAPIWALVKEDPAGVKAKMHEFTTECLARVVGHARGMRDVR